MKGDPLGEVLGLWALACTAYFHSYTFHKKYVLC